MPLALSQASNRAMSGEPVEPPSVSERRKTEESMGVKQDSDAARCRNPLALAAAGM